VLGPIGPAAGPAGSTLSQYLPTDYRRPPPATNPNVGSGARFGGDSGYHHRQPGDPRWDWHRLAGRTDMMEVELLDLDEGMV